MVRKNNFHNSLFGYMWLVEYVRIKRSDWLTYAYSHPISSLYFGTADLDDIQKTINKAAGYSFNRTYFVFSTVFMVYKNLKYRKMEKSYERTILCFLSIYCKWLTGRWRCHSPFKYSILISRQIVIHNASLF